MADKIFKIVCLPSDREEHPASRRGFECSTDTSAGNLKTENTGVAQLVEHWSPKPGVGRSSRSSRAK